MAAILQLRRGTNSQTGSINFAESELFYNQSKETLQIGYASILDGNLITLTRLDSVNTGSLSLTGDITASNAYFRGDVKLDGQIFLGDVPSDNINVNAQFSGSLIPSQSNAFDLGSITNPWRTIYSNTINGAITDTHILAFTASEESKNSTLATYTGSIDTKFNTLGTYSSSIDTKFTTLASYTASVNQTTASLNAFTSSQETKNDTLGETSASLMSFTSSQETKNDTLGTYTASIDTKNNTLGTYTASIDTKFNTLGDWSASIDTKNSTLGTWSGSTDSRLSNIETFTSSQETKNNTLGDYTSSIDTKFNTIGDYTASINSDLSQLHSYTSSLKTAFEVNNQDLIVYGNLTVQGTQTSLNTTEVYVEDKTLTLASGSVSSATADGAGIIIDGAQKSILWDNINQSFNVNTKVSSSVGFKGDGSELTGVHAADVEFNNILNKPTLISSSAQVTQSLDLRYLEINGDSVVSGSSQIDLTQTTNYITGVKTRLNAEGVISGSTQITNGSGILSSSVDTYNGFSASVDSRLDTAELFSASIDTTIKNKLNVEAVISGSSQVTASLDLRYENIASGTHTLISGSSQLTSSLNTLYEVSGSVSSLVGIRAASGSLGSAAWYHVSNSIADGNPNVLGNGYAIKSYVDQAMVLAGAGDITEVVAGNGLSGGATSGSATLTLNTGSTHFTDGVKTKLNTEGVISGSSQITPLLPSGVISGSSQLSGTTIQNLSGSFTGSFKGNLAGTATYSDTTKLLNANNNQDYSLVFTPSGSNGYLTQYTDGLANLLYNPSTNRLKSDYIQGAIEATNGVISGSAQLTTTFDGRYVQTGSFNTFTASQEAKDLTIASYTASNDSKWSTLGSLSGSFARVDISNTFNASQVISGSLTITQDLIVLGSSSIQNISSSDLVIGTSYVTLNTFSPSSRYAGLRIVDSGSAGSSGSFLYDAVQDEFIFVHKGDGTHVTSSHFVLGPETYDNLGNETYIAKDKLAKSLGNEHIVESNITDTGVLITLGSNTIINGTLLSTGTALVSGSSQITKTLQQVTTAGATTSDAITITNATDSTTKTSGALIVTGGIGVSGAINAGGDVVAYASSDRRLKNNIQPIENPIDKINQIGGYTFDWDTEKQHIYTGKDYGVIAQEIEEVFPELVQTRDNGYKAVKYDKLVSVLIEGIKHLSKEVEDLKSQLNK